MIPTLTSAGDAGTALGMDQPNIAMVSTALGRVSSADKASLEYMNLLTERGIGAMDWQALLINPYITGVEDIQVEFQEGRLSLSARISTIYGEGEVSGNV